MFDIARELEAGKFMRAGDFLYAAGDPSLIRDFAPGAQTLEGFLFPATYELPRHPAASELTAEMVHKFKEEWKHIAPPPGGGSTDEGDHRAVNRIVTLASLVERETPKPEERPLVASGFQTRLRPAAALPPSAFPAQPATPELRSCLRPARRLRSLLRPRRLRRCVSLL